MNTLVEFIIENEEFNILNNEMTLFHKDDNDKIIKCYKSLDNIKSIIGENLNIVKISKQFWLNFKNLNHINLSHNKIFKFSLTCSCESSNSFIFLSVFATSLSTKSK